MKKRMFALAMSLCVACGDDTASGSDTGPLDAGGDSPTPRDAGPEAESSAPSQPDTGIADAAGLRDAGTAPTAVRLPPSNGALDYQLGGAYAPPQGVRIVSRDRSATPAANLYNICYVNGFQAQPNEDDFWLKEQPDLVLRDSAGKPVIDPDWDELLLDISTPEKRARLAVIVGGWIDGCADAGFDAVEIDNLDTYARSGKRLTMDHAVSYMALLAASAHARGLAIAQKNATELVSRKEALGTDFVLAEECARYDECDVYMEAYGEHVLMIEYRRADFTSACQRYGAYSIVLRDLQLVTSGSNGYVFEGC